MRILAADMREAREFPLGGLPYFNWRVSGQRCLDSAFFLREKLPVASALRWEQCQTFGELQEASSLKKRAVLPELLERLAEQEERFIASLSEA